MKKSELAAIIMRAQPPHVAHIALIRDALSVADRVLVILGSAHRPRTPRNPFTWEERREMISICLAPEERSRVLFEPLRDYHDQDRWVGAVNALVDRILPGKTVVVVGHEKDSTSRYLQDFHGPRWTRHAMPSLGDINATDIRRVFLGAANPTAAVSAVRDLIPVPIQDYLQAHLLRQCWQGIRESHAAYEAERQLWGKTPFMHGVLAADAVVQWQDEVLLIVRNKHPGMGLLATPGGHVDPGEVTLNAAIRELREECGIGLMPQELKRMLAGQIFLESPTRSERPGRVVSMAYHFKIDSRTRPEVRRDPDEVREVIWAKIGDLPQLENRFFDDHFMNLDHWFQLT